jgi:hypothetical protein
MKELNESDILGLERKLDESKKEERKKVMVDIEVYETLLKLSKTTVKAGKMPDRALFNITVEDNGDHVQVYQHDKHATHKLGNIYKDGSTYEADASPYPKVKWGNFTRALAYLISPRGMT